MRAAKIREERGNMNAVGPKIRDRTTRLREERMHVWNCVQQDCVETIVLGGGEQVGALSGWHAGATEAQASVDLQVQKCYRSKTEK